MFKKQAIKLYNLSAEELTGFWQEASQTAKAVN